MPFTGLCKNKAHKNRLKQNLKKVQVDEGRVFYKVGSSAGLGNADGNVGGNVVAKLAPDGTPLLINAIPGCEPGDPHRRTDYRVHHITTMRDIYLTKSTTYVRAVSNYCSRKFVKKFLHFLIMRTQFV